MGKFRDYLESINEASDKNIIGDKYNNITWTKVNDLSEYAHDNQLYYYLLDSDLDSHFEKILKKFNYVVKVSNLRSNHDIIETLKQNIKTVSTIKSTNPFRRYTDVSTFKLSSYEGLHANDYYIFGDQKIIDIIDKMFK